MQLFQDLWRDELGAVLSAEVVTVASIGVVSAVAGLSALASSVNGELTDVAKSIRSLDQSYSYRGFQTRNAWYAGSSFRQAPVEQSLAHLDLVAAQPGTEAPAAKKTEPSKENGVPPLPKEIEEQATSEKPTPAEEKIKP